MTDPYRVLVTGSRDFRDPAMVEGALDAVLHTGGGMLTVIYGACPSGADRYADNWARQTPGATPDPHRADWGTHGPAAGPIRNSEMVAAKPDLCLAFFASGALNKGTIDCASKAQQAGIVVLFYCDGCESSPKLHPCRNHLPQAAVHAWEAATLRGGKRRG